MSGINSVELKDAENRSIRTFLMGLASTVALSAIMVLSQVLPGAEPDSLLKAEFWQLIGIMILKDAIVAANSFAYRWLEATAKFGKSSGRHADDSA